MGFYDECRGALFRPGGFKLTRYAFEYCGFDEGAVIADLGCGTGETAKLLEREFPVNVINVEPSFGMSGGSPNIIAASVESTPFESESLDGALCECVLSLCEALTPAFGEIHRIIKPGGFMILSDVYSKAETVRASGALKWLYTKEFFCQTVQSQNFEIVLFEDCTRELAKMSARLIMEGAENALCNTLEGLDTKTIGYFLLIARRAATQ